MQDFQTATCFSCTEKADKLYISWSRYNHKVFTMRQKMRDNSRESTFYCTIFGRITTQEKVIV